MVYSKKYRTHRLVAYTTVGPITLSRYNRSHSVTICSTRTV